VLTFRATRKSKILSIRREASLRESCRPQQRFDTVAKREEPMAVSKELLDILVCPVCKTSVKMTPDQRGLKCSTCRRVYPVRDDIPVMLVDEARIDAS
jgi:uncharacterized protein